MLLLYLKIRLDEDSVLVSGLAKVCFFYFIGLKNLAYSKI